MNKTIQRFLTLLPVIALTACGHRKSATMDFPGDPALRNMLGIRSLTGSLILPSGEDYYEIAVCNYEDGRLIKRQTPLFGFPQKGKADRQIKPQLLWGNVGGKMMVSVDVDGNGGPQEDPFWNRLDGAWRSIANSRETSPDGWVVLGYVCSQASRGSNSLKGIVTDFRYQLEISKYVGALAVRTFKTEDEMRRAMKEDPIDGAAGP